MQCAARRMAKQGVLVNENDDPSDELTVRVNL